MDPLAIGYRTSINAPHPREEDDVGLISGLVKANLLKRLFSRFSRRAR
ncbi:hypothetical protein [Blastococcus sp. KM273129]|nr:hypothetical protein [Blastococcus sp. KM273129]